MKKTLLLVFIHGFKGGDDTFAKFPDHLRTLVSDALPNINVVAITYPRFETRGELHESVARFKEWLQDKVIDLEVAAGTPSPTVDPSVRTILVGHSMGGIVAAETLLSIARDGPVPSGHVPASYTASSANNTTEQADTASDPSSTFSRLNVPDPEQRSSSAPPGSTSTHDRHDKTTSPASGDTPSSSFLFPYVQGILAFDTPYLGIHPGVVAHGAESQYNTASAAVNAYNSATKFFGMGAKKSAPAVDASKSLPDPASQSASGGGWGRYALYAGGAAALAAVGSAAYLSRSHISTGWNWVGSHLAFVGCLAKGAELAQRVERVVELGDTHGVGFADFYTKLGQNRRDGDTRVAGQLLGDERLFCVVPADAKQRQGQQRPSSDGGDDDGSQSPSKKRKTVTTDHKQPQGRRTAKKGNWIEAVNTLAENEIAAHKAMFTPKEHPGYYSMSDKARNLVVTWVDRRWYESSTAEQQPDAEGEEEGEEMEVEVEVQ